jgi:hypothetical protein
LNHVSLGLEDQHQFYGREKKKRERFSWFEMCSLTIGLQEELRQCAVVVVVVDNDQCGQMQ